MTLLARLFISWCFVYMVFGAHAQDAITIHSVGYGYYNAYLIAQGKNLLLIDVGIHGKEDKLERNIQEAGFSPKDIDLIILTHAHGDHVGGAAHFQNKYQIPVLLHKNEQFVAQRGTIDSLKIGTSKVKLARLVRKRAHRHFPSFIPDIVMQEDTLHLDRFGFSGKVVVVEGHTPGSIIVVFSNTVFVGDLLRGGLLPFARKHPEYHFFAEDVSVVNLTLAKLLKEDFTTWYVGHGGPLKKDAVYQLLH